MEGGGAKKAYFHRHLVTNRKGREINRSGCQVKAGMHGYPTGKPATDCRHLLRHLRKGGTD